jgi:dienelactone hydrolase
LTLPLLAIAIVACSGGGTAGPSGTPRPSATPAPATPAASGAATGVPSAVPSPGTDGDPAALGRQVVAGMAGGDFAGVEALFDETMRAALPEAKLRELWDALLSQLGAYQGTGDVKTAPQDPYTVVLVRTEFATGPVNIQVTVDSAGRVAGLFVRPVEADSPAPGASPTPSPSPAAYVSPDSFHESDVTVGAAPWALPGTLTMPNGAGPFPAVVLVHGSGPNDRDETLGPNKPFRDLAQGLASRGIAVLRYDKRTMTYGKEIAADVESLTVKEETVDDAVAAVELLRSTPGVDPEAVFVLGHSLGGYLGPRILAAAPDARGLIIVAGTSRPLPEVIVDQYEYLASLQGSPSPDTQAKLDTIREQAARAMSPDLSPTTPASQLPLGVPAPYWIDLGTYDPLATVATLDRPVLVLQGGRDYQVTAAADFAGWQQVLSGRQDATFHLYPALNHLFIAGKGQITPAEYEVPGHVAPEVVADIATWISKVTATTP